MVFFFGCLSKCTSIFLIEQKKTSKLNLFWSSPIETVVFFFIRPNTISSQHQLIFNKWLFLITSACASIKIMKSCSIFERFFFFSLFSLYSFSHQFFRASTFITDFDFFNLKIACVMIFISISFSALAIIAFIKRHKWSKPAKWITQQHQYPQKHLRKYRTI